jgi:hypothetical protein
MNPENSQFSLFFIGKTHFFLIKNQEKDFLCLEKNMEISKEEMCFPGRD